VAARAHDHDGHPATYSWRHHPDVAEAQLLALRLLTGQTSEGSETHSRSTLSRGHLRPIPRYLPEREALAHAANVRKGPTGKSVSATDPSDDPVVDASIRGRALTLTKWPRAAISGRCLRLAVAPLCR
jgi:hypothetical protein